MSGTHMKGLEGTNPLGFMAAVGIQVAFESEQGQPRIWWSDDIIPHAVTDSGFTADDIAEAAIKMLSLWKDSPVLKLDGDDPKDAFNLKFHPCEIREYLERNKNDPATNLSTAFVAEGGLDEKGKKAKPSHLHFTAGQQSFLSIVSEIIEHASKDELLLALNGPWKYNTECPTLRWDVTYDPSYALSAINPTNTKKSNNPGPEALAILGLSRYPVFANIRKKTVTQGCAGTWKTGWFSWPLWSKPSSPMMVKSLLAHVGGAPPQPTNTWAQDRTRWYRSWGVFKVLRSPIRRSDKGGYGTFGPHQITWEAR